MFTVYGIDECDKEDCHREFDTLRAALLFLCEAVHEEMTSPDGAMFERYAIAFDRDDGVAAMEQLRAAASPISSGSPAAAGRSGRS